LHCRKIIQFDFLMLKHIVPVLDFVVVLTCLTILLVDYITFVMINKITLDFLMQ